jgi:hypothetical protein
MAPHPAFVKHSDWACVRRTVIITIAVFGVILVLLGLVSRVITVDHFHGAYGVSIGVNNDYMSIGNKFPFITMEHAS